MLSLALRPATADDNPSIRTVLTEAFGSPNEADLVEGIRGSANFIPALSLVAKLNREIVGYVLFSAVVVETPTGTQPALALAPLAVRPGYQNQGIGTQLVKSGLAKSQELGYTLVAVVGHPQYYARFGFQPASLLSLKSSLPLPDEVFMVLELHPGALPEAGGTLRYPAYFEAV